MADTEMLNIFKNMLKCMEYRGLVADEHFPPIKEANFNGHMEFAHYTFWYGVRPGGGAACAFVLVAPDADYTSKLPAFRKLMTAIYKVKDADVLIVSKATLPPQIAKFVAEWRAGHAPASLTITNYDIFRIELFKHVLVPAHREVDEREIAELEERHKFLRANLPKIRQDDPAAVWIGLKPGKVAEIISRTMAGEVVKYRICV